MSSTGTAGLYRLYAARCIELSRHLADIDGRAVLLNMAQAWIALADQAEKNDATTVVYETPEPRP
jgi:hypothetical protein